MALSKQQEMVYDRLKGNYVVLLESNKMMGDRTSVVVGGGTALAAFFGAKEILASQQVSLWLIVGSAVASLVAFVAASFVWAPGSTELPGANCIDEIWEEIVNVDEDVAFANMVNDLIGAIESERRNNSWKAIEFRVMLIAIWIQIFLVLAAVWLGK